VAKRLTLYKNEATVDGAFIETTQDRERGLTPKEAKMSTPKTKNKKANLDKIAKAVEKRKRPVPKKVAVKRAKAKKATAKKDDAATAAKKVPAKKPAAKKAESKKAEAAPAKPKSQRQELMAMSVKELKAKYEEVIKRKTGSSNKAYLVWKINLALDGKLPEPKRTARPKDPAGYKVIPFRLGRTLSDAVDAAIDKSDINSRSDFYRHALAEKLTAMGEKELAEKMIAEAV
jgi:hypothetical protein